MIKLLGFFDIIASIILFAPAFNMHFPDNLALFFAVYLIIKGLIFIKSWVSIVDITAAITLLLSMNIDLPRAMAVIISLLLLQKGIFSTLSH